MISIAVEATLVVGLAAVVAEEVLAAFAGKTLEGDDSAGEGKAVAKEFVLPDGAKMIFERERDVYPVKKPYPFRFQLVGADGKEKTERYDFMMWAEREYVVAKWKYPDFFNLI